MFKKILEALGIMIIGFIGWRLALNAIAFTIGFIYGFLGMM